MKTGHSKTIPLDNAFTRLSAHADEPGRFRAQSKHLQNPVQKHSMPGPVFPSNYVSRRNWLWQKSLH